MLMNPRNRAALLLIAAAVLLVLLLIAPGMLNSYRLFLATQVLCYSTAALGLTVLLGWSGQIAMAHAGFFGIGAYGSAFLYGHGVPWILSVVLAGLVATVFGIIIGLPAVRLRGFYLAIATLAFGELIVRIFVGARSVTNGSSGLSVQPFVIGNLDHAATIWYASLFLFIVTAAVLWFINRSRLGRAFRAVRDIEIATGSLALSAVRYKLIAFAISAFIGAVGGAAFGQLVSFLTPEIFGTTLLIQFLVVVFVGGVTRLEGAVIGSIFVILGRELLQDVGSWQRFAFGAALVVVVRFMPDGLVSLPSKLFGRGKRAGGFGASGPPTEPGPTGSQPSENAEVRA